MKKIISLLVVVALMAACLATVAFAAEGATITVESANATVGAEVTLKVSIAGNTGFAATKISFEYDATALQMVGVNTVDMLLDGGVENDEAGIVSFARATNLTKDGVLMTVTFKVLAEGEHTVKAVLANLTAADQTEVAYTVVAGTVSVAHACKLVDVAEVPATCTADGVKAHQKCEVCGKLYLNGKEVTAADLVIEGGHTFSKWSFDEVGHWFVCGVCGENCDYGEHTYVKGICSVCGYEHNPNSGDTMISVAVAAVLISAMSIVALPVIKKRF